MTRVAREVSPTGTYHLMVRGINKMSVFNSDKEKTEFMRRIEIAKNSLNIKLLAYCLMDNHVHILVKEPELPQPCPTTSGSTSQLMHKINTGYAGWYNRQHVRVGPVFQERFRSEAIKDESQLLAVARYIHKNPVKIGRSVTYWTSYNDYLVAGGITDTKLVLGLFSKHPDNARRMFVDFIDNEQKYSTNLDSHELTPRVDKSTKTLLENVLQGTNPRSVSRMKTDERNELLRKLKAAGLTVRAIEETTGVPKSVVARV